MLGPPQWRSPQWSRNSCVSNCCMAYSRRLLRTPFSSGCAVHAPPPHTHTKSHIPFDGELDLALLSAPLAELINQGVELLPGFFGSLRLVGGAQRRVRRGLGPVATWLLRQRSELREGSNIGAEDAPKAIPTPDLRSDTAPHSAGFSRPRGRAGCERSDLIDTMRGLRARSWKVPKRGAPAMRHRRNTRLRRYAFSALCPHDPKSTPLPSRVPRKARR